MYWKRSAKLESYISTNADATAVCNPQICSFIHKFVLPLSICKERRITWEKAKLSTSVSKQMWISVNNLCIKGLEFITVDNAYFYRALVHKLSTCLLRIKMLCDQGKKKLLDQLSPYPQSLLLILNYKISL
jgi:hypothetical protein